MWTTEWESHSLLLPFSWSFSRLKTIDGEPIKTPYVMRRRGPDGKWQYRFQTETEALERAKNWAW